jgi:glycosidase
VNVADQLGDAWSLLRTYRRLIRVRRRTPALQRGGCTMLHSESEDYLAFLRTSQRDRQSCLVVLNMAARPQRLAFELPSDALVTLFSSRPRPHRIEKPRDLRLGRHEIYVGELE